MARAIALGACGILLLGGCSTSGSGWRETIGIDQRPPDEFLVVSKAPLVVPPNMNLRPPAPGAPPLNQTDPRALARSSVTGSSGVSTAAGVSAGEQAILARANTGEADPYVREELLREEGIATKDPSLADQILVARREKEETLDPYGEAGRLRTDLEPEEEAEEQAAGEPTILLEEILGGY